MVEFSAMRFFCDVPIIRRRRSGSAALSAGARVTALLLALAPLLAALPARADTPDWESLADVKVIEVVTQDADGDLRETKVWLVLVDGEPYLRTGDTRWLENLRRDPNLVLRIEGREYEARVEEVPGDEIVEKVDRASLEKYGWQERMIHPFRMSKPEILKLLPREGGP
jgi:hypothetical protein